MSRWLLHHQLTPRPHGFERLSCQRPIVQKIDTRHRDVNTKCHSEAAGRGRCPSRQLTVKKPPRPRVVFPLGNSMSPDAPASRGLRTTLTMVGRGDRRWWDNKGGIERGRQKRNRQSSFLSRETINWTPSRQVCLLVKSAREGASCPLFDIFGSWFE